MAVSPIWLLYAVAVVALAFLLRELWRDAKPDVVSYEAALEAAKLMKDWGSWMTTVSTAVIGTSGILVSQSIQCSSREPLWAYLSVLMFALSITFAAWVLGSLPSVVTRLNKTSAPENDIYELSVFSFVPVRVGVVAALQHTFFVLGIYCFALFVTGVQWKYALVEDGSTVCKVAAIVSARGNLPQCPVHSRLVSNC